MIYAQAVNNALFTAIGLSCFVALRPVFICMKRFLFACFCCLLFSPLVRADNGERTRFDFGPKIGVNLSEMYSDSWQSGYKSNLLGGLFMSIHGSRFGVQAEGLFSQTTYVTSKDFNTMYHTYLEAGKDSLLHGRFRLSYFNIPVMLQVRILGRAWLQAGVQYSGIVSVQDMDAFVKDAESLFNTGTMSGVAGLWIDITKHVNAGARYVMGWSDLNKSSVSDSWKQRNVQFHLGLTF